MMRVCGAIGVALLASVLLFGCGSEEDVLCRGVVCGDGEGCWKGECIPEQCVGEIEFPTEEVEYIIRYHADKRSGPITYDDVKDIEWLDLSYMGGFSDFGWLHCLSSLKRLYMGLYWLADIEFLRGMTQLEILELGGNRIKDIEPIGELMNLRELDIGTNLIHDFSPLANLTGLVHLQAGGNDVRDLSPLYGLTQLEELGLGGMHLRDASFLSDFVNLRILNVGYNEIEDIEWARGLENLEIVVLRVNDITDVRPLAANFGIGEGDEVYLDYNDIDCEDHDQKWALNSMYWRGVKVYTDCTLDPGP